MKKYIDTETVANTDLDIKTLSNYVAMMELHEPTEHYESEHASRSLHSTYRIVQLLLLLGRHLEALSGQRIGHTLQLPIAHFAQFGEAVLNVDALGAVHDQVSACGK
jgi:hypothetical protein